MLLTVLLNFFIIAFALSLTLLHNQSFEKSIQYFGENFYELSAAYLTGGAYA